MFLITGATAGWWHQPRVTWRTLEVRALFLQVLVVCVEGHKLLKAEGIHGCLLGETTGEKYNNLLYLAFPFFFKSSSVSVGNALFLHPSLLLTHCSLPTLFGLQWNFDARPLLCYWELNRPCPDLLSAATFILPTADVALKPSENTLFHEKHITQTSSAGSHHLVVFLLHFGSALIIFLLACLKPCSRGKSNYCQPKKRESAQHPLHWFVFRRCVFWLCLIRCAEIQGFSRVHLTSRWLHCPVLFF